MMKVLPISMKGVQKDDAAGPRDAVVGYRVMLPLLLAAIVFAIPTHALAESSGKIKVCKEGASDDWPDPEFWAREVVVPVGTVFKDAGHIDSKDPLEGLIRLRVMVTEAGSVRGKQKCTVLRAIIPPDSGAWGTLYAEPVRTKISKADRRILEIERWGDSPEPTGKLAPWADVVPVEVTIEADFR